MKMHIYELGQVEAAALSEIELVGVEEATMPNVEKALQNAYWTLRPNGLLEFAMLDWDWCVKHAAVHGPDERLSIVLFEVPRRSVWNERTLVKALFKIGFYRLWIGRVPECPEYMLYVKARKSGPES